MTGPHHPLPARYRPPTRLADVDGDIVVSVCRRMSAYVLPPDEVILRACRGRMAVESYKLCDAELSRHIAGRAETLADHERRCREYDRLTSWGRQLFDIVMEDGDGGARDAMGDYLASKPGLAQEATA